MHSAYDTCSKNDIEQHLKNRLQPSSFSVIMKFLFVFQT